MLFRSGDVARRPALRRTGVRLGHGQTIEAAGPEFKHLFERVVDFVAGTCFTSYMRSIEHTYEPRICTAEDERRRSMTSPVRNAPLRLTRRGRIVLTFVMMVGLVVAGFTLGRGSSQAASHSHLARHTVTVRAGDTLWSLAARVAPQADPRDVVAEIQSLNHLSTSVVEPGEQLAVPTVK